jgi:hypothetical protein
MQTTLFSSMGNKEEFTLAIAKKPIRILSLFFGFSGILISLIVTFLVNDALGKTEQMLLSNLDGVYSLLINVQGSVTSVESEVSTAANTIDDVNKSINSLALGVEQTSGAIGYLASSINQVSLVGLVLGDVGPKLNGSAEYMLNSSKSLKSISSSTSEHKQNILNLRSSLTRVKNDISTEAQKVQASKTQLSSVFGTLKLANIVLFVMFFILFLVLILNSIAGLL